MCGHTPERETEKEEGPQACRDRETHCEAPQNEALVNSPPWQRTQADSRWYVRSEVNFEKYFNALSIILVSSSSRVKQFSDIMFQPSGET